MKKFTHFHKLYHLHQRSHPPNSRLHPTKQTAYNMLYFTGLTNAKPKDNFITCIHKVGLGKNETCYHIFPPNNFYIILFYKFHLHNPYKSHFTPIKLSIIQNSVSDKFLKIISWAPLLIFFTAATVSNLA